MSASVRFTGDWGGAIAALEPRSFEARLKREVRDANAKIGRAGVRLVQDGIRSGRYAPNDPDTVEAKRSSTPLVRTGALARSITFAADGWGAVRIGLLTAQVGAERVGIAAALHEGFRRASSPSRGRRARRTGAPAGAVVPARPFLVQPLLRDPAFAALARRLWVEAVRRAFGARGAARSR